MKKKKAAKKPSKKAGKKKKTAKKKKTTTGKPVALTITDGVVSKESARASKSKGDRVVWHSNDNKKYTLTFNMPPTPDNNPWPFIPNRASATIEVPAGGDAGPFTIRGNAVEGGIGNGYGYSVTPPPNDPTKPIPEIVPDP